MSETSYAQPPREPSAPPPRSSLRYRAENVNNGARSHIITNMIDSFRDSGDGQQPTSPGVSSDQTPLRSSGSSFDKYRQHRQNRSQAQSQTQLSDTINTEYMVASRDDEEVSTDEDAALPPTVPTAKPPSGLSKLTRNSSRSSSFRFNTSSPRNFPPPSYRSPSPSVHGQRGSQPPINVSQKKSTMTSSRNSQRPSFEQSSSRDASQGRMTPDRSDKGKGRAIDTSSKRAPSAHSQYSMKSGPATPERTSSMQASSTRPSKTKAHKSVERADSSNNAAFVLPKAVALNDSLGRKERLVIAEDADTGDMNYEDSINTKSLKSERPILPKRTSSKSPAVSRAASEDSRRRNPAPSLPASMPVASEEANTQNGLGISTPTHPNDINTADTTSGRVSADPDDETDVMKRIRELKAAKEQRDRDRAADDISIKSNPQGLDPPRVNDQLALSPEIGATGNDTSTKDKSSKSPRFASSPLAKSVSSAGASAQLSASKVSFSNDAPGSMGRSPVLTNIDEQLNPQKSPLGSRAGSRARRPSFGKPSSSHRRGGSAQQSLFSAQDGNESQLSVDSVEASVSAYLQASRMHQTVVPPGERRIIAFSEVGDPEGFPVICCVGMGITRHAMTFYDELAASLRLRLITPDRPGVGDSTVCQDGLRVPLRWPDDVSTICTHLNIQEFALLAHSAGAVFALATALRMPQNVRCKIHLLASWIPPSQLSQVGLPQDTTPAGNLPRHQRMLRIIPTALLKLTNAASMTSMPSMNKKDAKDSKSGTRTPRKSTERNVLSSRSSNVNGARGPPPVLDSPEIELEEYGRDISGMLSAPRTPRRSSVTGSIRSRQAYTLNKPRDPQERERAYNSTLTSKIWELARANANPVVDLLICIERHQPIGFRYVDISRPVVLHHGTKDTRVPVENARWVAQTMQRAEIRILEGEGHSLMASAGVMASVLTEIAQEWEDEEARTDRTGSFEAVPSHSQRR